MLTTHVTKLYELLSKIMILLENEIVILEASQHKSAIDVKRSVTDSLNKLVTLLVQLNKLSKEEKLTNTDVQEEGDEEIIARFIAQHNSGASS